MSVRWRVASPLIAALIASACAVPPAKKLGQCPRFFIVNPDTGVDHAAPCQFALRCAARYRVELIFQVQPLFLEGFQRVIAD